MKGFDYRGAGGAVDRTRAEWRREISELEKRGGQACRPERGGDMLLKAQGGRLEQEIWDGARP